MIFDMPLEEFIRRMDAVYREVSEAAFCFNEKALYQAVGKFVLLWEMVTIKQELKNDIQNS